MTLELNTKLENTVNKPAIPARREYTSHNWTSSYTAQFAHILTKARQRSVLLVPTMATQLHSLAVEGGMMEEPLLYDIHNILGVCCSAT
jgi:hypothetical protein